MKWRHELKFIVNDAELALLGMQLGALMKPDPYQGSKSYKITSLYFDDIDNRCYFDNLNGNGIREKYRLRYYGEDTSFMRLEKKCKNASMTMKNSFEVSRDMAGLLLKGEVPFPDPDMDEGLQMLLAEMRLKGMQPKSIVRYERTAFTARAGNVRITFDRNISASTNISDFMERSFRVRPLMTKSTHVLEVKYDEFLPVYIKELLEDRGLWQTAFSKYAESRRMEIG